AIWCDKHLRAEPTRPWEIVGSAGYDPVVESGFIDEATLLVVVGKAIHESNVVLGTSRPIP
ncbi:MAG: hypothetical protein JRN15_23590, partial [Nitrososphaerota archaeon]|nr:hypothetical protein [Nitrososphaerota archaeon]